MRPEKLSLTNLPEAVRAVADRLAAHGGKAFLVGGAVRDLLLDGQPEDFDLATDLPPPALRLALPEAADRDARFGNVRLPLGQGEVAVTTLREEEDYRDRRRPQTVRFVADPAKDAVRRDFTMNAIYLDLASGAVLDPCGGVADLRDGWLRVIGAGRQRFTEDPLRLLRAVRFAARCGLRLEPATAAAVRECAGELRFVKAERQFAELTAMFTGHGRGTALRLLCDLGLADVVLPEAAAMRGVTQPPEYHPEGDVLTHACLVLDHVPAGDAALAWTAVLHDIGKPPTWRLAEDRIRFDGHDVLSARMAEDVLWRLRSSRQLRQQVVDICRDHIRIAMLQEMRPVRRERWMRQPDFPLHLAFHRADCLGSHGDLSLYETALQQLRSLPPEPPAPWCTGRDVLRLGVPAGPQVGELLRQVDAAMNLRCDGGDRESALQCLRELVTRVVKPGAPAADKDPGPACP